MNEHDTEPVSRRVVEQVAEATDSDPMELEPLYERIDPDALDDLFSDPHPMDNRRVGHVSFTMAGCEVVVWADDTVDVITDEEGADAPLHGGRPANPVAAPESLD